MMSTGAPLVVLPAAARSHGPTAKANRELGSGRVSANRIICQSPCSAVDSTGVLKYAVSDLRILSDILHGFLHAGSSKVGHTRRAPSGSRCVIAYHSPFSSCRKAPSVSVRDSLPVQWMRTLEGIVFSNC